MITRKEPRSADLAADQIPHPVLESRITRVDAADQAEVALVGGAQSHREFVHVVLQRANDAVRSSVLFAQTAELLQQQRHDEGSDNDRRDKSPSDARHASSIAIVRPLVEAGS